MRHLRLAAVLAAVLALLAPPNPALGQADQPEVERVSGANRYATAAAVALRTFPDGAELAYVATGEDFPDALASGPAAALENAPVLLTGQGFLPTETRDALVSLDVNNVVVLGGRAAISDAVVDQIRPLASGPVERRSGEGRVETAAALSAAAFEPGATIAFVANGTNFPDALAGGAAGGALGGPVLLVTRDTLPEATAIELERLDPARIVVLGGTAAVSADVVSALEAFTEGGVTRQFGADRYGTAAAVSAATYLDGATTAFVATGFAPFDALAGAPAAALEGAPVLLVPRSCVPPVVLDELNRLGVGRLVLLGGTAAVTPEVGELVACDPSDPEPGPDPTPDPDPDPDPGPSELTTITSQLRQPWGAATTPDGRTFISERDTGRVLEVGLDGSIAVVLTIPILDVGEGGLLGLAVSPDYAEDGYLYAYRTTGPEEAAVNQVVRFFPGGNLEVILDGIPGDRRHNGGRIAFGPDGLLYVGTGDAEVPERAQDPGSLSGKILRATPEGDVPADNPTAGSYVYSLGHRNVQGLAWDAAGRLYATEFGSNCNDEINRIVPGGNYGWPDPSCSERTAGTIAPLIVRQPDEASWSGATFLVNGAVPEWEGSLFAAGLRGERLWRFTFDADGNPTGGEDLFVGEFGRLRHAFHGTDGALYLLTGNGGGDRLLRYGP